MTEIKKSFFQTLGDKDSLNNYQKAYIIILLKAFFELADNGKANFDLIADYIKQFYKDRKEKSFTVENRPDSLITNIEKASLVSIKNLMRKNPLSTKFLEGFISEANNHIIMASKLWSSLSRDDIEKIKVILNGQLHKYFEERVDGDSMTIPDVERNKIEEAMKYFDQNLRDTEEWINFTEKKNHKYAISHNDKLYPVKKIISLATGAHVSTFSGGNESNNYIKAKGFKIVELNEVKTKQLILKKKVDWSTFNWGITVPVEYHNLFYKYNNEILNPGDSKEATFELNGTEYKFFFRNVNRNTSSETLQIRYDSNEDLKKLLREKFIFSYNYIMQERKRFKDKDNTRPQINVPDDRAEYISIYSTGVPYKYSIEISNTIEQMEVKKR